MAIETQNSGIEGNTKILADSEHGVIGSWVQLAVGMAESSSGFGFGIAQDVRAELRRRTDVTLTFVEDMSVGTFKFVRRVIDRIDGVTADGLGRGEAAVLVATRAMRRAGHGVTELASSTLSDTIGSNGRQKGELRTAAA